MWLGPAMTDDRRVLARRANPSDAREVVRLAGLMYASMGLVPSSEWLTYAAAELARRLGDETVAFVVDRSDGGSGLAASGVGLVSVRMPSPNNLSGQVGYIQWVATETALRRQGMGRAVMEALLGWFEQRRVPVVELHATRDGETLYRSLGFGQEGGVGATASRLGRALIPASQLARRVFAEVLGVA